MFLPIKTDVPIRHTPVVNYALIAINVLVFIVISQIMGRTSSGQRLEEQLMLWAESPRWYQFLTSMFMHGGWMHLIGNMVFLWVFGNALNSKLGNATYLMFYIACGLAAGAGYVMFENMPVVGASGAIFGVTAGFVVLFPLSRITIAYFFFFIGLLELNGMFVVGAYVVLNVFYLSTGMEGGVAYLAHLFGALWGFICAWVLLMTGATARDQFDMVALFKRWRQRAAYRSQMANPMNRARAQYGRVAQQVDEFGRPVQQAIPLEPQVEQIMRVRGAIGSAVAAGDAARAGQLYSQLMQLDPEQVLPARQQADLGNYLTSAGQHELAARVYESLLAHYPTYESSEQIQLLLGVIYARYLNNPARAKDYLAKSLPRLRDPRQQEMARAELSRITGKS
jgi:membrane associated rhomboid family serine protease